MATKSSDADTESGRGRLQRDGIVSIALDLMNRIGLDALTLRRLAQELHVQAPALYWHFKNKQELLNAMAETMVLSSYPSDAAAEEMVQLEWSEWLGVMANTLRNTLLKYRDGARLFAVAEVSKGALFGLDLALGVLVKAGFGYQEALIGVSTIVNYTLGITFEDQTTTRREGAAEYFRELLAASNLPHVTAALGDITEVQPPDSDYEFELGLQVIIAGIKTMHQVDAGA